MACTEKAFYDREHRIYPQVDAFRVHCKLTNICIIVNNMV